MNGTTPYYPYMPRGGQTPAAPSMDQTPWNFAPPTRPPVIQPSTGMPFPSGTNVVPPGMPGSQEGPPTPQNVGYIQYYLSKHIGEYVKIEFVLGTNMFVDREGTITEVGNNYVVIQEPRTDDYVMCDLYAIKFVTIFR